MTAHEPKRLSDSDEVPQAVRDALRVLAADKPSAQTVLRIQHTLDTLPLNAGAGVAVGTALKVGALLSLAGLSAWVALGPRPWQAEPKPAAHTATRLAAPVPPTVPAAAAVRHVERAPEEQRLVPSREGASAQMQGERARAPRGHTEGRRERQSPTTQATPGGTNEHHATPAQRRTSLALIASDRAQVTEQATAQVANVARDPGAAAEPTPSHVEPRRDRATVTSPAVSKTTNFVSEGEADEQAHGPEPQDEASLLYQARRVALTDPAEALHLLQSHRRFFPHGAFVEEREVLTIQMHRRLGNSAKASAYLQRFKANFPNSVYQPTLSQ